MGLSFVCKQRRSALADSNRKEASRGGSRPWPGDKTLGGSRAGTWGSAAGESDAEGGMGRGRESM